MKPSARVRTRTRQAKGCLKRSFRETHPATGLAAGLGQQRRPWRADGLDIGVTADRLKSEWPLIRDQILLGADRPMPVRRVMIPEPEGGERELGVPTVRDRLMPQALLQVLQPTLAPPFSAHS